MANREAHDIQVLNLSFSAPPQSHYWDDPLNQAVMAAWQAGIVVVASAGNTGPEPMSIGVPGNVPYVITVGAMTDNYTPYDPSDDTIASFSSSGPTPEGFVKPELVARVKQQDSGEPFILNIEIQNNNDHNIPWRMLRYLSDIRLGFPNTRVRQHLIYIGKARFNMPSGIEEEDIRYTYGLLDMRQVDCAKLIARDNPDALVLAILCDFRNREPRSVVHHRESGENWTALPSSQ